jgi:hypothetical protein
MPVRITAVSHLQVMAPEFLEEFRVRPEFCRLILGTSRVQSELVGREYNRLQFQFRKLVGEFTSQFTLVGMGYPVKHLDSLEAQGCNRFEGRGELLVAPGNCGAANRVGQ